MLNEKQDMENREALTSNASEEILNVQTKETKPKLFFQKNVVNSKKLVVRDLD